MPPWLLELADPDPARQVQPAVRTGPPCVALLHYSTGVGFRTNQIGRQG
jgi:hypothetical protein